jgi:tetratricopeptide (TPR) repeat protein
MTGQLKIPSVTAIALVAVIFPIAIVIAQESPLPPVPIEISPLPSPEPPPPLTSEQKASMEKFVQEEIQDSQEVGDRIEEEMNKTFGWTISLLNVLMTVLIAIPILTGLAAFYLRQSVIDRLVRDIERELELVRDQLKLQAAKELKEQLSLFKQELETSKNSFTAQLQMLSLSAQQEKDRIFEELYRITPSIIQEEFVTPEIEQRIQELTQQLEQLKLGNSQLLLTVEDYLKQGDAFYLEKRYEDAVDSFEKALERKPDTLEAWLGKAKAQRKLQRYEESLISNDRAIQLQPDDPSGWFGKGFVLMDMQKYAEAVTAYEQAILLQPDKSLFWRNNGYALMKLCSDDQALDCLNRALELKPESRSAYYWKGAYYASKQQIELAIQNLEEALKRDPEYYQEKLQTDPDFDVIRHDDRFQQLLKFSTSRIA